MPGNELPLKIRVDIRDKWNNEEATLQRSIATLKATLGHNIVPQIQWASAWEEFKKAVPDPADFIPAMVLYTTVWYDQMNWRLENDAYADWTEQLLTALSQVSTGTEITLHIEVQESSHLGSIRTAWNGSFQSFNLIIPRQAPDSARLSSSLDQEFERFFGGGQADAPPAVEGSWADVKEPERPPPATRGTSSIHGTHVVPRSANEFDGPKALPTMTMLARPGDLFQNTSPYILIVELGNPMLVQCSHQRSLELLAQYLNKWGRPNKNDAQRRNVFTVDLIESDFAVGVNDTLRIEPRIAYGRKGPINPAMVLAFVEGMLGFQFMHASGDRYVYRSGSVLI
ncbi:hypothetical protein NMY22_g11612 [Coprinellus aureogranulatus]|nr:hypothetical protein NMY22_g11612 [Coprinellus aureogranulatus]